MNVVYGFGGMRSDGNMLSFKPTLPKPWKTYSFKLLYRNKVLTVTVEREWARFKLNEGEAKIIINSQEHLVTATETLVKTV